MRLRVLRSGLKWRLFRGLNKGNMKGYLKSMLIESLNRGLKGGRIGTH